jgi:hypothetical protein
MTSDIDDLFGAQQRNLRSSLEKAMQDRDAQEVAERAAKLAERSAKRCKTMQERAARTRQAAQARA